jgi:hypothetical protein
MNIPNFYEILNRGYSLDQMYLLLSIERGTSGFPDTQRVNSLLQSLVRKGLCTEAFGVTELGREMTALLLSQEAAPPDIRTRRTEGVSFYAQWLKCFPITDGFTWKGRTFPKTRALRKNTEKCRELFARIIREGEYTANDLCNAIIAECLAKMEESVKRGENKMSYVVNSESYLRQRVFEGFVDDGRKLTPDMIALYHSAMTGKMVNNTSNTVDI